MRKILLISLLLLAFLACTTSPDVPAFDNPLDPTEGDYEPPETTILSGPENGAVVDTHTVTFTWEGNENVVESHYNLVGIEKSDWITETTVTFSYLDEGDYQFEVRGRYITEDEDTTAATRIFTIDDIHGPALWLSPRRVQVYGAGSFTLDLMAEDVADLMVVYAQLQFDPSMTTLDSFQVLDGAGDFLSKYAGPVVSLVDSLLAQGSIDFNLAVMGASPPGIDGSGALVRVHFTPLTTGNTSIGLGTDCVMISSDLDEVTIAELVSTIVEVGP